MPPAARVLASAALDERLQRWTVEHRLEPLDTLFVVLSRIGSLGAVWILLAVVLSLAWRRAAPVLLVVAGVVVADLLSTLLKVLAARPRPYVLNPEPEPLLGTHLDLTLPSGHAATSFASALVLAALVGRLWATAALFALASGIAWSRVYVGVHYPSDVLFGALLGLGVAAFLLLAARRLEAARAPRTPAADPPRSPPAPPPG